MILSHPPCRRVVVVLTRCCSWLTFPVSWRLTSPNTRLLPFTWARRIRKRSASWLCSGCGVAGSVSTFIYNDGMAAWDWIFACPPSSSIEAFTPATGLIAPRKIFPLVSRLTSLTFCWTSTSCGSPWKVSSRKTPSRIGMRSPAATWGSWASASSFSCSSSLSSWTASGAAAEAARSFSYLSVAGQSTRELGISSHSSRSEL